MVETDHVQPVQKGAFLTRLVARLSAVLLATCTSILEGSLLSTVQGNVLAGKAIQDSETLSRGQGGPQ